MQEATKYVKCAIKIVRKRTHIFCCSVNGIKERNELKKNIERNLNKLKTEMKADILLGVNEKLMSSRTMTKIYFNEIKNILNEVLNFIKKTKRFERKKVN